jgi:lipopolysaccharide transport system ATP-binding protein
MTGSIFVQGISKKYNHYPNRWMRIIHTLSSGYLKSPAEKWILRDINLRVLPGEAIAIIGQNGSGKSTLLKIVAGITIPFQGQIKCEGNIAALLELGIGFNLEFTGRQNTRMICQLYGLDNKTIEALIPDIIAFSELGSYFDQPLRTYSSGMQVRLAFSAATAVRPDILIVDEALSVGDVYFQHKSISRIRKFKEQGTTLLFVSHDPSIVKTLCERAILLDKGQLVLDDCPENVLNYYNAVIAQKEKDLEIKGLEIAKELLYRSGNKKATIESVELLNQLEEPSRAFSVGETAILICKIHYYENIEHPTFGIVIRDRLGNDIFGTNTFYLNHMLSTPGLVEIKFKLQLNLGYGHYSITVASHTYSSHIEDNHDWWNSSIIFQILPKKNFYFIGVSYLPIEVYSKKILANS